MASSALGSRRNSAQETRESTAALLPRAQWFSIRFREFFFFHFAASQAFIGGGKVAKFSSPDSLVSAIAISFFASIFTAATPPCTKVILVPCPREPRRFIITSQPEVPTARVAASAQLADYRRRRVLVHLELYLRTRRFHRFFFPIVIVS